MVCGGSTETDVSGKALTKDFAWTSPADVTSDVTFRALCAGAYGGPVLMGESTVMKAPPVRPAACIEGTTWSKGGRAPCAKCTPVGPGSCSGCTATSDRVCKKLCTYKTITTEGSWSITGIAPCMPCAAASTCTNGVKTDCSTRRDTVCNAPAACTAGTDWSAAGTAPCAACATDASCTAGVKSACSATANTVCHDACTAGTDWSAPGTAPCAACATDASCATGVKAACSATANTVCNATPISPDAVASSFGVKTSYSNAIHGGVLLFTKNVDRAFYGLYLANGAMKGEIAELKAGQSKLKTLLQARRLRLAKAADAKAAADAAAGAGAGATGAGTGAGMGAGAKVKTTGAPAHTIPNMALHCVAATLAMAAAAIVF